MGLVICAIACTGFALGMSIVKVGRRLSLPGFAI
ncbi:hypothetical protein os4_36040 (plasmid) [Comamonadaceae bacterium OS-4]|nr:hypothetical protein os4_36040 [Comamonadaceae bacterium OS-4]